MSVEQEDAYSETTQNSSENENELSFAKVVLSGEKKLVEVEDNEIGRLYGNFLTSEHYDNGSRAIPAHGLGSAEGLLRALYGPDSVEVAIEDSYEPLRPEAHEKLISDLKEYAHVSVYDQSK